MFKLDIFKQMWVLYVAVGVFVLFSPDYKKLMLNAKMQTLSRLTPPMNYFEQFVNKDTYIWGKLNDCVYYHQKVIEFIPSAKSEAYAMKGYCLALEGKTSAAIQAYKQSLELNPTYFWTNYNLGILYMNEKKQAEALSYFNQAVKLDPKPSLMAPMISKIYRDVMLSDGVGKYDLVPSLMKGYQRTELFIEALNRGGLQSIPRQKVQFF